MGARAAQALGTFTEPATMPAADPVVASAATGAGGSAPAALLDVVHATAKAQVARAVETDVLFQWTPSQVALACFMAASQEPVAAQTAFLK